ncbi:NAD(P)/FAD-dependent oxidoreductase [Streptomyces sp. CT34]|uniref:NAD(P)/FAD-dependent oxidoreductase n=1 Tax=Streptomyces sp. CT34 TaxID=1553907 RepID=UPI0005B85522|nr:NAD(P)/FAD-dependent oxidoreductase [Streptomyces sp. CT34]
MLDVIVIGAGPGGLQAALTLGRSRRSTLLLDAGPGRNEPAHEVHNFLSREGAGPEELRAIGLRELAAYPTVEVRRAEAVAAISQEGGYTVRLSDGTAESARRLVLATGVVDVLPDIEGLAPLWGRTAVHCPYCHGWEVRDRPFAVLALRPQDAYFAAHLTRWSADVVLCLDGKDELPEDQRKLLASTNVQVRPEPVVRLEGKGSELQRMVFESGPVLERGALFLKPPTKQRSDLPRLLGCDILDDDCVQVDNFARTAVRGVYAVGDMARRPEIPIATPQVALAAAEGATAAVAIDTELVYGKLPWE